MSDKFCVMHLKYLNCVPLHIVDSSFVRWVYKMHSFSRMMKLQLLSPAQRTSVFPRRKLQGFYWDSLWTWFLGDSWWELFLCLNLLQQGQPVWISIISLVYYHYHYYYCYYYYYYYYYNYCYFYHYYYYYSHNYYSFLKCDWCINCCILHWLICKVVIGQLALIGHL